ncbi:MAG TPA: response regulator transcription factor [Candidatus Anoxymicrobiaceae bacterium]|jgi:DNA-binding response OmpR family regulator
MKKILIIEDEAPLAEALRYTLEKEGYRVAVECDGKSGLERFLNDGADLVTLDLMLPGMDGLDVCRRIRAESMVPILMLTAKDSDLDEVLGLEMGADDYVTKPFDMRKLIARIKALLRRSMEEAQPMIRDRLEYGDLVMDIQKHEVRVGGRSVHLTPTEYGVLELLMRRPGKVIVRETLLNQLWDGYYGSSKTLDVHVRHLREKIEEDPSRPGYVKTVRGTGYRLDKPTDENKG